MESPFTDSEIVLAYAHWLARGSYWTHILRVDLVQNFVVWETGVRIRVADIDAMEIDYVRGQEEMTVLDYEDGYVAYRPLTSQSGLSAVGPCPRTAILSLLVRNERHFHPGYPALEPFKDKITGDYHAG